MNDINDIQKLKDRWTKKGSEIVDKIKNGIEIFDLLKEIPFTNEVPDGYKDLRGINLERKKLQNSNLSRTKLDYTNLNQVDFQNSFFQQSSFKNAEMVNSKFMNSSFYNSCLENVDLGFSNLEGSDLRYTNFTDANLFRTNLKKCEVNEQTEFDEYIIQEKDKDYKRAEEVYRNLKDLFKSNGLYEKAGKFYYRESVCNTKCFYECLEKMKLNYSKFKAFCYWIYRKSLGILMGYGEKPLRILIAWILVIALSSLSYFIFGIEYNCEKTLLSKIGNSIYLSIVTFTTLGYGDIVPVGWGKIIAATEATLGYILLSLFLVVFVRKAIRD